MRMPICSTTTQARFTEGRETILTFPTRVQLPTSNSRDGFAQSRCHPTARMSIQWVNPCGEAELRTASASCTPRARAVYRSSDAYSSPSCFTLPPIEHIGTSAQGRLTRPGTQADCSHIFRAMSANLHYSRVARKSQYVSRTQCMLTIASCLPAGRLHHQSSWHADDVLCIRIDGRTPPYAAF
ncbi:hypothetical protein OH77DRAFT_186 [Trametes cingulata]|nr:hypothetical protein OH77DRAFT_186 [Trametes cingulata]